MTTFDFLDENEFYRITKAVCTMQAVSFFGKEATPPMATTRIMPLHIGKGRTESRAISDIMTMWQIPKDRQRKIDYQLWM